MSHESMLLTPLKFSSHQERSVTRKKKAKHVFDRHDRLCCKPQLQGTSPKSCWKVLPMSLLKPNSRWVRQLIKCHTTEGLHHCLGASLVWLGKMKESDQYRRSTLVMQRVSTSQVSHLRMRHNIYQSLNLPSVQNLMLLQCYSVVHLANAIPLQFMTYWQFLYISM